MNYPPGLIVVPNSGMLRHTQFVADLFACDKPVGTQVSFPQSGSVVQNLNRSLMEMRQNWPWLEWAWLQSDDHAFPKNLLLKLLDHEAPIVCPLIVRRSRPDQLVFGREIETVDGPTGRTYPAYESTCLADIPDEPFTVEICGTGGMLVRSEVLDAVGFPYFESTDGVYLNEDIEFSRKVRAVGFEIKVDPACRMAHLMTLPVWPT